MMSIDRFEGDYAICEQDDGSFCEILRSQLPADAGEGDCIKQTDAGYVLDQEETRRRREYNRALLKSLLEDETSRE